MEFYDCWPKGQKKRAAKGLACGTWSRWEVIGEGQKGNGGGLGGTDD